MNYAALSYHASGMKLGELTTYTLGINQLDYCYAQLRLRTLSEVGSLYSYRASNNDLRVSGVGATPLHSG